MKDKLRELLESMSDGDIITVWNEYQNNVNGENQIYNMSDFDELLNDMSPWEIARAAYYSGKFCPAHDYFWFNGYGNLESSDFPTDNIYIDDIVDYIINNNDSLYNDDIQEVLDEYDETED